MDSISIGIFVCYKGRRTWQNSENLVVLGQFLVGVLSCYAVTNTI